jgi:hydrogenase expression/formation protein HypC
MCLGIPGKVVEKFGQEDLPMGKVDFGGILKEVCLAYTPEVQIGQYVLVHVGFAISQIDEDEAAEIFSYLKEIDDTMVQDELEDSTPHAPREAGGATSRGT